MGENANYWRDVIWQLVRRPVLHEPAGDERAVKSGADAREFAGAKESEEEAERAQRGIVMANQVTRGFGEVFDALAGEEGNMRVQEL